MALEYLELTQIAKQNIKGDKAQSKAYYARYWFNSYRNISHKGNMQCENRRTLMRWTINLLYKKMWYANLKYA